MSQGQGCYFTALDVSIARTGTTSTVFSAAFLMRPSPGSVLRENVDYFLRVVGLATVRRGQPGSLGLAWAKVPSYYRFLFFLSEGSF